jgi:hypothetical protein
VPKGFLHGFVTLEPDTEVLYKCTDTYAPDCDGAVLWSSCGIDWPFDGEPVLSAKDAAATPFARFESPFTWEPAHEDPRHRGRGLHRLGRRPSGRRAGTRSSTSTR